MKTNIYAPFWIIKAAVPHMPPGSAIVATTSEQAYDPTPDLYDYAQTKAATMNFVKSLGKQLASKGIRGEWRGAGADLDAAAGEPAGATMDKLEKLRRQDAIGTAGSASGVGRHLRAIGGERRGLRHGAGLRCRWWIRPALAV